MSIIDANFSLRLSGGASNAVGNTSLGGVKSSEVMPATVDALFDPVTAAQALAGSIEYRCVYLHNANASDLMTAVRLWLNSNPSGGTAMAVGIGAAAVNATEAVIANESVAPAGVSFGTPANAGAGLALGNIPAGQHKAIWFRRTVTAGATNTTSAPVSLGLDCETT